MSLTRRTMLAAPLLLPSLARAQAGYPDKPVKIIVPFPPGQAADILTRVVADQLSQRWPQRVVVENRGGGAGAPALEAAARAPADGYTLVAGTSGTLGVNPSVLPNIPYDAERDFAAITSIAIVPLMLVAHPSHPANSTADIIRLARQAGSGGLDIATAGPATSQHLAAELFALRAGVTMNMVHYRGSGPGVTDLIAGNVKLMMDSYASARGHLQAGRLKPIAVTTAQRIPQLPDVPTIAEVVPGYRAFGWTGLNAPAATPLPIIAKINADVTAILREPAVAQRFAELGGVADPMTPEAYAGFIRAEIAQWREIVRIANVKLEG